MAIFLVFHKLGYWYKFVHIALVLANKQLQFPALAGYTAEGDQTLLNHNYPYNLTSSSYRLEWTEDEDADSEDSLGGTLRPDDFSLSVKTNYLVNLTENSTSGEMILNFNVLSSIPI